MPLQDFVDNQLPTIKAAWLNGVDVLYFTVFNSAATVGQALTALGATATGTALFQAASAAAARTTLGATSVGDAVFIAANAAAARTAIASAGSGAVGSSGLTMATSRLLGRTTANTGAVEELTAGAALSLSGGSLDVASAGITAAKLNGAQSGSAPIFGARAWCMFDGTVAGTNAPTAGGNVTSITKNGTGDYTVNITTALADANYAAVVTAGYQGQTLGLVSTSTTAAPTASAYRFRITDAAATLQDSTRVMVVFYR